MVAKLIVWEERIACLMLALMVICVFAAAVGRSFGMPLIWSVDVAQLLFIWVCMLGANCALRRGEHVGVDALLQKLPLRRRLQLDLILYGLTLVFLWVMAGAGLRLTFVNPERTLGSVDFPYAWVTLAVPVGALLMSVTLAGQWWHMLRILRGHPFDENLPFLQKYHPAAAEGSL